MLEIVWKGAGKGARSGLEKGNWKEGGKESERGLEGVLEMVWKGPGKRD